MSVEPAVVTEVAKLRDPVRLRPWSRKATLAAASRARLRMQFRINCGERVGQFTQILPLIEHDGHVLIPPRRLHVPALAQEPPYRLRQKIARRHKRPRRYPDQHVLPLVALRHDRLRARHGLAVSHVVHRLPDHQPQRVDVRQLVEILVVLLQVVLHALRGDVHQSPLHVCAAHLHQRSLPRHPKVRQLRNHASRVHPQTSALRLRRARTMQQHVVELQVAMRHLVPMERRQRAHHPRNLVVQETTVSRERLPRHTLAYVPMPAVLHREAPASRLRVHVAAVHLQNVVVARKTLVEVQLRLCRRRPKVHLGRHRLCSTRDGDVSQIHLSLRTFA